MRKTIKIFITILCMYLCTACNDDDILTPAQTFNTKEQSMVDFACILSKIVYDNTEVRELLKNYGSSGDGNIAYQSVKMANLNGVTMRDILVKNSSEKQIHDIENALPKLNILFSSIGIFNINAKNYDVCDATLPVVVKTRQGNMMYINGYLADMLYGEDIPNFHTLVITEEDDDITVSDKQTTITDEVMKKAYEYANSSTPNGKQGILQRDYLYYDITQDKTSGMFNGTHNEYIRYIDVEPRLYSLISDEKEERLDMLWTNGTYLFRIDVLKSDHDRAVTYRIRLRPDEIWNINLDNSSKRPAVFDKNKLVYTIDTDRLTTKRHYFTPQELPLGAWNLAKEATRRYITVLEEDYGQNVETTNNIQWYKLDPKYFNGDRKLFPGVGTYMKTGLGSEKTTIITDGVYAEWSVIGMEQSDRSDQLGCTSIDYSDQLVKSLDSDGRCCLQEYSIGAIKFAVAVK